VPAKPIIFCSHVAELGGAEMVALDLMQALDRTQFTPHLAIGTDGPLAVRAAELGVAVHEVPLAGNSKLGKARAILRSRAALRALAARLGSHVLVANTMIAGYAGVLAQRPGLACVWHLHTVMRSRLARAALRRAAAVIAPSHEGLEAVGRADGHHIANGVPDRFFSATANETDSLRQQLGVPDSASLLGMVGRLDPHKGHDVLLAALAHEWATEPPHLVIAGAELFAAGQARLGGYGERLREQVTARNLEGRVHWLGDVPDTSELLCQLDCLVVPSIAPESAPRTIAEAQAAGCPVVASAVGGIPSMVQDGQTGLLVAKADAHALAGAVQRILADQSLRGQIAQRARDHAHTHYRMLAFARQCEAVFADANAMAMTAMN